MKNIIVIAFFLCFYSLANAQETLPQIDSLANYWQGMGKYDEALVFANKSLEINQKSKIDTAIERSLYRLAAIYSDMNEFDKSERIYLDIMQQIKKRKAEKNYWTHAILEGLGILYTRKGEYEKAEKSIQAATDLSKETFGKENDDYALDLILWGQIAYQKGEYEKGIELFLESKAILEKYLPKRSHEYGVILGSLGTLYSALGQYEMAEPFYEKSLEIALKISGKKHEYLTGLNNIAFLYFDMGDYERAESCWVEAIDLASKEDLLGNMHSSYADYLVNLATLYLNLQRYEEAEQLYKTGLNIYAENEGKMTQSYSSCINNLAVLYQRTNRKKEAEDFYKVALEINRKVLGKEHPEYAALLNNLAVILEEEQKYEEAKVLLLEALAIYKKSLGEEHPIYAGSLMSLGVLHQHAKNYELAKKFFLQSVSIWKNKFGTEHPEYAASLEHLARLHVFQNQIDSAKIFCWAAFAANSPDDIESEAMTESANLDTYNYYSETKSLAFFETLLEINQHEYAKNPSPALLKEQYRLAQMAVRFGVRLKNNFQAAGNKLQLAKTTQFFAYQGINAAFQLQEQSYLQDAFSLAEHNKSIILADATKAQRARSMGDLPKPLALEELNLIEQIAVFKKLELETRGEEKIKVMQTLGELNLKLDALKKKLEKNYPKYYKIKYANTTAQAEEIRKILDDKTLFLEYFIADSSAYLFALTKDNLYLKKLDISMLELSQKIADLRSTLTNYDFIIKHENDAFELYNKTAYWFFDKLLASTLKATKGIERILIVTDGELGHLPFEVFLTENIQKNIPYKDLPYLIKKYKISYNYSATLFVESQRGLIGNKSQEINNFNGKVLAMAAVYDKPKDEQKRHLGRTPYLRTLRDGLEDLPAARAEVEALSKNFVGDFFQGNNCNELIFKEKAGEYGIIHLAMHGLLNQRAPILSSLAFSENGDTLEDNFLEAWEIAHLKLNAQLVVLSACETGYGKFEQGEGVMSLARSFMYAGVPSLVVSLWQVNDFSTSAIMEFLYQNLADGMDKAEALQKAKMQYLEKAEGIAAHPAFWAAFVQLGDTNPIALQTKSNSSWIFAIGGFAVLAIGIFVAVKMRKKE